MELRCAYCHDPAGVNAVVCPGCRTVVHADCGVLHGGCPTLGCRRAPALPVRVAPRPQVPAARSTGQPLLGGSVLLGAVGVIVSAQAVGYRDPALWVGVVIALAGVVGMLASARGWGRALDTLWRGTLELLAEDPPPTRVVIRPRSDPLVLPSIELPRPGARWYVVAGALTLGAVGVVLGSWVSPLLGCAVVLFSLWLLAGEWTRTWPHLGTADVIPPSFDASRARLDEDVPIFASLDPAQVDDPQRLIDRADVVLHDAPTSVVERLKIALGREDLGQGLEADLHLDFLLQITEPGGLAELPDGTRRIVRAIAHACRDDHARAVAELGGLGGVARLLRIRSRRGTGDLAGALAEAEDAVREATPADPWPFEARGRVRLARAELPGALADLDEAVRRAPAVPWLRFVRGITLTALGDPGAIAELAAARPGLRRAALWQLALRAPGVDASGLQGFDAQLARCLQGELSEAELLAQADSAAWGERSRRRKLRRAHALLAVRDPTADGSAVLALGDDGSPECDFAHALAARARV